MAITSSEGFTDHEILIVIMADLKQHMKDSVAVETDIRADVSKRPTRTEIVLWVTGVGGLAGISAFFGG